MDKSFNDQELSDIMKEIEALEEGFQSETEATMEASSVLEDLAEMDEVHSIPTARVAPADPIPFAKPNHAPAKSEKSSMTFKVQGEMSMDLSFEIGGKCISLTVSEAGLTIEMEGGVNFNVPLEQKTSAKKAA